MLSFQLKAILLVTNLILLGPAVSKQEFCEKDDKTGLCKTEEDVTKLFNDDDDDGPCWFNEGTSEKPTHEKLVRLDGVKVYLKFIFISN